MCLDTLHINFRVRGRRVANLPDLVDINFRLSRMGYHCENPEVWSGGRTASFRIFHEGQLAFLLKGYGADEIFTLQTIEAYPQRFLRWADFWAVLEAMDDEVGEDGLNRIIRTGIINRIDYTLDLEVPIQTIMRGLFVRGPHVLTSFADVHDPYISHEWVKGRFSSFSIGKEPKILKIYDKARQLARIRPRATLNSVWDNDEPCQRPRPDIGNWTRLEMKLTGPRDISRLWNSYSISLCPNRDAGFYSSRLSELPQHLSDIGRGATVPFKGVFLNHIEDRSPSFAKTVPAHEARHEMSMGLLMVLYHRMMADGDFWRDHQRFFSIHPWNRSSQPSSLYRMRMNSWSGNGLGTLRTGVYPNCYSRENALTTPWPEELSTCEPLRRRNTRRP